MTFAPRPRGEVGGGPEFDSSEREAEFQDLISLVRTVAEDETIEVSLGEKGGGNFFDEQNNRIVIDPLDLTPDRKWQARINGVHEGAHRAISRGPKKLGLKDEEIRALFGQLGFGYIHNIREDITVDTWAMNRYRGTKEDYQRFYDESLASSEGAFVTPDIAEFMKFMGYVPKFAQYGTEIVRYWHTGKFGDDLDSDVRTTLLKTHEAMKAAYGAAPSKFSDEAERMEKAHERFFKVNKEVWPEVKKLVDMDASTEKIRQMLNKAREEAAKTLNQNITDFLPEKLRDELAGHLKKCEEGVKKGEPPIIKMDDFSEGLRRKLMEFFMLLALALRIELEGKAKKTLAELEDKMNVAIGGHTEDDAAPLHSDLDAGSVVHEPAGDRGKPKPSSTPPPRPRSEISPSDELQKQSEREQVKEEMKHADEWPISAYNTAYHDVFDQIAELQARLERIFRPERQPDWQGGFATGDRVSLPAAMKDEAREDTGSAGEVPLWERKTVPKKMDYRFTLFVDLSGSMGGEKIEETFKGVVEVLEALDRVGVQVEVIGFQDIPILYKSFDDALDDRMRRRMGSMASEPTNEGVHNEGGFNSDGYGLEEAHDRLVAHKGKHNFLVVFSDGFPQPDRTHGLPKLETVVQKIKERGVAQLIGLGLGPGTEHVARYYPTALPNLHMRPETETASAEAEVVVGLPTLSPKLQELARQPFAHAISGLLEDMIRNPEEYEHRELPDASPDPHMDADDYYPDDDDY